MSDKKFLFETTVKRVSKEQVTEKRQENGQEVSVTKTKDVVKPVKVAILKPDRKLFKGAEIFYAKTLSHYLKEGLLPYSLVAKRYANDGGALSDVDDAKLKSLQEEAVKLEKEFFAVMTSGTDEETIKYKNDLLVKINNINNDINRISSSFSSIFDSTAEVKSRTDTMEWWSLFLIYIENDKGEYESLFKGETYENRIKSLEEFGDKDDPFYNEVINRLSYLISFWFTARNAVSNVDFGTMEKLYVDTLSSYQVPATETETPVETTS